MRTTARYTHGLHDLSAIKRLADRAKQRLVYQVCYDPKFAPEP